MRKESWVPSPNNIASEEIENRLSRLSFDTAASVRSGLSLRGSRQAERSVLIELIASHFAVQKKR
jgi:hypothetical protein